MLRSLSFKNLAANNLIQNSRRTFALASLVGVCAAVLFGSFIIASSLKSGLSGMKERVGADLMIVPEGYERGFENVLLFGEPSFFYMDRSIEDQLRAIEGIEAVTSQFYLASASESCCDFPVQIIGFEPESDFLITPWVEKSSGAGKGAPSGALFCGNNVHDQKGQVTFYSKKHQVTARLSKSGSGMDNAVFADFDTVRGIYDDARAKGFSFWSDGNAEQKVSAVFIRLGQGVSKEKIVREIKKAAGEVQIIQQGRFIKTLAEKASSFTFFLYVMCILFLIVTVIALALVFSLIFYERRREFSILRSLGASRVHISGIILWEALILGGGGAVCGVFISSVIILPFNYLISQKLGLPFSLPSFLKFTLFALGTIFVMAGAVLASAQSIIGRILKLEVYRESK